FNRQQKELDYRVSHTIRLVRNRKGIKQRTFLRRLTDEWEKRTGELRFFDRIEYGDVHFNRLMVECIIAVLGATEVERAYILESGGFNGWAELVAKQVQSDSPRITIALDDFIEGKIPIEDLDEIMKTSLEAIKLHEQQKKLPPRQIRQGGNDEDG